MEEENLNELQEQTEEKNKQRIEHELKKFNWGAAYFGLIWSAINRCFKKWLLYSLIVGIIFAVLAYGVMALLNFINPGLFMMYTIFGSFFIPFFLYIIIFIYVGIHGNRWAWESYQEKDIVSFQKNQKVWGIVAGVFMVFTLFGWLLNAGFLLLIINSPEAKNPDAGKTYISEYSCSVVSKALPTAIKNAKNDDTWLTHLGEELEKNGKINYVLGMDYIKKLSFSVEQGDRGIPEKVEFDVVREKPCTLSEANCYISAPVADSQKACRFYFDDNGKVVASKKTNAYISGENK